MYLSDEAKTDTQDGMVLLLLQQAGKEKNVKAHMVSSENAAHKFVHRKILVILHLPSNVRSFNALQHNDSLVCFPTINKSWRNSTQLLRSTLNTIRSHESDRNGTSAANPFTDKSHRCFTDGKLAEIG